MKDPMKSIPFLPKIVPGVGWGKVGGVGCVMQGWGGSCRGGVGWGVSYRGGVGHVGVGSCRGRVGVGWVMQGGVVHVGSCSCVMQGWGWGGYCRGGVM